MEEIQKRIYKEGGNLYTANIDSGSNVYGEELYQRDSREFRAWHANRSKAAAAVKNGIELGIEKDDKLLYLGASTGTTVSHFSDIVSEGFIWAVEYSESVARSLIDLAEKRKNIAPIVADARKTEDYGDLLQEVDVLFQDISQSDQAEIFKRNAEAFLKKDGLGLLAVKAHSISSSRPEEEVFNEVKQSIQDDFEIIDETRLEPYEKNHLFLKLRYAK
jgi:fibrillarin-like pre-rRNA processing protein